MARITIFFHGIYHEKIGKERIHLNINNVEELFRELKKLYPDIEHDIRFNRVTCLINGRNIETMSGVKSNFEDFDLVSITLKDGGLIDFFPPDGGG